MIRACDQVIAKEQAAKERSAAKDDVVDPSSVGPVQSSEPRATSTHLVDGVQVDHDMAALNERDGERTLERGSLASARMEMKATAATRLQAAARGWYVRRVLQVAKPAIAVGEDVKAAAATVIQTLWRGVVARDVSQSRRIRIVLIQR